MPVYSHSRLSSFENCPLKYRYRYVDRIRTGFESIEAFMGKRVHEALEALYADLDRARSEGPGFFLRLYERRWEEAFNRDVRVVRPDLDAGYYRKLGGRCVTSYWERHYPFPIEREKIIGLELKIEAALDPAGRFRLVGYVDRAQHAEPGIIEIHDYKTTATLPREGSLRFDRQLPLYEIALRQRFPETREVRLVWHFLAHGVTAVERRSPDDLERVKRATIGQIQTVERAYEFPPKKGPICAWCEYQEICPVWKDARPQAPPAFPNGRPAEDVPEAAAPAGGQALAGRSPESAGPTDVAEPAPRPAFPPEAATAPEPAPGPASPAGAAPSPGAPPRRRARSSSPDQLPLF